MYLMTRRDSWKAVEPKDMYTNLFFNVFFIPCIYLLLKSMS